MRFDSKALKDFEERVNHWWIMSPVVDKLQDWYWSILGKPLHHMKKMLDWYCNVFRHDYDFDALCIFRILEYKLQRIEKCLKNGHAIQEPKDMKALRIAIKLCKRLDENNYGDRPYERHNAKWGEMITWLTPTENKHSMSWNHRRPKANTDEEKEQEGKEFMRVWEIEEMMQNREQRWLYGIMSKYLRVWWD